ncbi:MAG: hypothetical protein L3J76_01760 [Candidatus Hydrothermae bacterium]|nr:hypothetical protein [Candidatus Hydrothermae bacterium]
MEEAFRKLVAESQGVALVLLLVSAGLSVALSRLWKAYQKIQTELLLERLSRIEKELEELRRMLEGG